LFRGKRKDNGEWAQGYLSDIIIKTKLVHLIRLRSCKEPHVFLVEVDPDTIGQCTDVKDKNGKLIFDGDVLKTSHNLYSNEPVIGIVEWVECAFMLRRNDKSADILVSIASEIKEIIGNIHDNPEFLREV